MLFTCLIDGTVDVGDKDLVVRSMQPSDVVVVEDAASVTFANIMFMCPEFLEDNYFSAAKWPYSPYGIQELYLLKSTD